MCFSFDIRHEYKNIVKKNNKEEKPLQEYRFNQMSKRQQPKLRSFTSKLMKTYENKFIKFFVSHYTRKAVLSKKKHTECYLININITVTINYI